MSEMDDEAFARMLQQQLLDEEFMLHEQRQATERQAFEQAQQQFQDQYISSSSDSSTANCSNSNSEPFYTAQGQPSQAQQKRHTTGSSAVIQAPWISKYTQPSSDDIQTHLPYEQNTEAGTGDSSTTNIGYESQMSDIGNSVLKSPPASAVAKAPVPEEAEDPDLQLARRIQELETMGLGHMYSQYFSTDETEELAGLNIIAEAKRTSQTKQEQEDEDARLARLMAQEDKSLRDLSLSNHHSSHQPSDKQPLNPVLEPIRPVPESEITSDLAVSDRKLPPKYATNAVDASDDYSIGPEMHYDHNENSFNVTQQQNESKLPPTRQSEPNQRTQMAHQVLESIPHHRERPTDSTPSVTHQSGNTHLTNEPNAQNFQTNNNFRQFQQSPNPMTYLQPAPKNTESYPRFNMRVRADIPTREGRPQANTNKITLRLPRSHVPALHDPSPLNQEVLDGPPSGHQRNPRNRRTQSPQRNQDPQEHVSSRANMPNPPRLGGDDLLPGDAFLDVPSPIKKKKEKIKRGLFGFGCNPENKTSTVAAKEGGKIFGFGRRERRGSAGKTSNSFSDSDDSLNNPSQDTSEDQRLLSDPRPPISNSQSDESINVPSFPVPEPVTPPVDTIDASPGPLPFSVAVSKNIPDAPEATVGRLPQILRNSGTCCVCNRSVQSPLKALDKKYHTECFRCITCHGQIDPSSPFAYVEDGGQKQPLHRRCYAELYGIKCSVCRMDIPVGSDGKVSFVKHPFFDSEQMCPHHAKNMTRRCTGCHRFEPENEPFADLNDSGRCVCLSCCRTVIVDSQEAQPLWDKVVDFFDKKLGMPIWPDFREIPILIVGYSALNDQMSNISNPHGGATQIMTRGLCLTEHQSGRNLRMNRMKFDRHSRSFVAVDAEERGFTYFQVPDASKVNPDASITAICCLSGLPKDLTASVLSHEATHAWIKLHPRFSIDKPIPPQVEEGCAQLIALLFLNDGLDPPPPLHNNDGTGPSDEKLRQYFKFSIETDENEVYGTGYRRAAMAYSKIGIEALMSHIVLYQDFPET